jgi:hypothetical protein
VLDVADASGGDGVREWELTRDLERTFCVVVVVWRVPWPLIDCVWGLSRVDCVASGLNRPGELGEDTFGVKRRPARTLWDELLSL